MVVKEYTRVIDSVEMLKKFNKTSKQNKLNGVKKQVVATEDTKTRNERSQVLLVEQELKFARALAGNDPVVRQKQLNKLKKWLMTRSSSSFRKLILLF